ncbi:hypothetical protein [Streptomyces cyanogenus]|uniref:DUF4352 domain-containing protein n=1 Tax=Streptomyces cyanogenus TaxID=80860 RepID=A0ABX7THI9_STRCY|nr:hypothetical protein [Streptomyces cyanogenus]QTD95920.1 hypothetical protein S1361_01115 [Streptomyces cyanogenus]
MGRRTAARDRPGQPSRQAGPAVRALGAVLVALAVVTAGLGTALWWHRQAAAGTGPTATARLGGLEAVPGAAGWATMAHHEMQGGSGYRMPSSMMPGAPQGDDTRLGIPITLTNRTDSVRRFDLAKEFSLSGGRDREARPLHSDTLGTLPRLNAGSAVRGVIYFDVTSPHAGDPPLLLVWKRDGDTRRMTIRMPGRTPESHRHGS